jgi:hypothetical protein
MRKCHIAMTATRTASRPLTRDPPSCWRGCVARRIHVDYLVIGAGASGIAFTDALTEHADVRVGLVDRRHGPGGHWLDAYPFVRLHQASQFYGVASTLLGGGRVQQRGPEQGLHERATASEICSYYERIMSERMLASGRIELFANCEYLGERRFRSNVSGETLEVPKACRVVDARYLSPSIPASTPPPFAVEDGANVVAVNDLARLREAPSQYVVVGAGKTATDAIVWLLGRNVDPNAIVWIRPRDPWMLNRSVVQPNPSVFLGMAADTMEAATASTSLDDLFLRLEDAGIMLRVDRTFTPTMARTPTLAAWELDLLRTIENVVRLGHLRSVRPGTMRLDDGEVAIARDALVVHCAADGLRVVPSIPIWGPGTVTLQPIRTGFPCFGAALAGYVEATRKDDGEKNRLCPSSPYSSTRAEWARMQVAGTKAAQAFGAERDIAEWANRVPLNPARIPSDDTSTPALDDARDRLKRFTAAALSRLTDLAASSAR